MQLTFGHRQVTAVSHRGAVCVYEFALVPGDGSNPEANEPVVLTTSLDVAFLAAQKFTAESLLVLYHTGDPVTPQFVVAEFHFDDETISHLHDHGEDLIAAYRDFTVRKPGDLTATPPLEKAAVDG